ncbi:hypothetical protein GWK47_031163 [Chionoecetes opilio]|uniref:Uncharacterized protein n=1 Tax=Chionoecetes opilio TaxID=41210 RepID=A0A8J4YL05_CHIOP|nr:hypothetical protein GWK47_031163 [Chionoecetes opilio]
MSASQEERRKWLALRKTLVQDKHGGRTTRNFRAPERLAREASGKLASLRRTSWIYRPFNPCKIPIHSFNSPKNRVWTPEGFPEPPSLIQNGSPTPPLFFPKGPKGVWQELLVEEIASTVYKHDGARATPCHHTPSPGYHPRPSISMKTRHTTQCTFACQKGDVVTKSQHLHRKGSLRNRLFIKILNKRGFNNHLRSAKSKCFWSIRNQKQNLPFPCQGDNRLPQWGKISHPTHKSHRSKARAYGRGVNIQWQGRLLGNEGRQPALGCCYGTEEYIRSGVRRRESVVSGYTRSMSPVSHGKDRAQQPHAAIQRLGLCNIGELRHMRPITDISPLRRPWRNM